MLKVFRKFFYKISLWNNKRKTFIDVGMEGWVPKLYLHEKYENHVKWILRILTFIGMASSFISFEPIVGFGVSLLLFLVEQFFEKSVFHYTTMFIQPLPNFQYKSEEWMAMIYAWPVDFADSRHFIIGLAFKTAEYAKNFFELIRSYNYGEDYDIDNNICLSLITEDPENYSVYIYPNHDREVIRWVKNEIDLENKGINKRQQQLIVQLTLCKLFPYGEQSAFKRFKQLYNDGDKVYLKAFLMKNETSMPVEIKEINPIVKTSIKIKDRELLTKYDYEFHYGKYVKYMMDE
jgi:hypothetical protein